MRIEVLGGGCAKCDTLEKLARAAVERLALDAEVVHVSDWDVIAGYGVMATPALVADGEVLVAGRVPTGDEVEALLTRASRPSGGCDCGGACC